MSLQVEKLDNNMAKLTIEVDEVRFEKAMQSAYSKKKGKITIPGFRKGKAPRPMIEKMYGADIFFEDAANDCIPEAYDAAVKESELEVVSWPEIQITQIGKGKNLIFTAEVAVKPSVTLGQYKGVEVPKEEISVSDEEIAEELAKEQDSNSRLINIEDRAVQEKDIVTIDFEGFVDGKAFPGGKGDGVRLEIGSGMFIPGFEDRLIGAQLEVPSEINVTFPEDYSAKELAGKDAVFKYNIRKIEVKELPELDDDFAQDVSEFNTLAELKDDIRNNLLIEKDAKARTNKENAVVSKVIENSSMEVPPPMIDMQVDQIVQDFERQLMSNGITLDQYIKLLKTDMEQFRNSMRSEGLRRIQTRLVLETIAAAEGITATDDDMEDEYLDMADAYRMSVDDMKDSLTDDDIKQIRKNVEVQKALTFITDEAREV